MNLDKISNFIKLKRKKLGLTQEELAQKLFVTKLCGFPHNFVYVELLFMLNF